MKRLVLSVWLIGILSRLWLSSAYAERIDSFAAKYQINRDGTVNVTETITYNAEGVAHHGIIRQIRLAKTNNDNQQFQVSATSVSVNAPFSDQSTNDQLNLKIGDANTTFTGQKTYVITYQLSGAITYFTDHDELYWNVTGNNWHFLVAATSATVVLPTPKTVNAICYTGPVGSTARNCSAQSSLEQATFSTVNLGAGEGLTIVVGFPTGVVDKLEPAPASRPSLLQEILTVLFFVGFYFLLPFGVIVWWFLFGRDPKVPPGPTSWFDPPKNQNGRPMLPAEVGLLTDENVDPRDITATIVSLAIRGWLKIKKDGKEYTFTKTAPKKDSDTLVDFEQILYDGLFKYGETSTTSSIKTSFPTSVSKAQKLLYKQLTAENYFDHNPDTTRKIFAGLGTMCLFIFNILLGATLLIFSRFMPRKTLLGAQKKEEALSLKRFLTSQERQLTFQEQNWYFFEKLLPYAVAFGVTKVWAERFRDLTIPEAVDWYQGGDITNAYLFASSLDSFSHSAAAITSTPYSSSRSSSGFSSGFSGGGSGGGGGGGGGGSW